MIQSYLKPVVTRIELRPESQCCPCKYANDIEDAYDIVNGFGCASTNDCGQSVCKFGETS